MPLKTPKLLTKEKKKVVDITKENIQKTWSREAWIKATRDYLSSQKTAEWKSGFDMLKERAAVTDPKYTTKQSEVEWSVNLSELKDTWTAFRKPSVVWQKPDTPIQTDTTDKVTTWTQDVWTTWITGATGEVTPDKTWFKDFDIDKDWMIDETELSWDYKKFYDQLSDTEKKQFLAEWQNALKNNLDITEVYAKYMRDYETTKGRMETDEEYRLRQQELSWEMAWIQESQTLRKASQWVQKLKQSIAYLWSQWMPWVSGQRMVSLEWQITEANKTYAELERMDQIVKSSRAMWEEKKAQQFERQMEDITTKLNDNIDKWIQDAYNTLIEADNNWKLDTVSELEAFRDKMYQDLDSSITGFTDASIEQLEFLITRQDNVIKEAKQFEANKWQINPDLSTINGYYYDMNGSPIYWANGQMIKIPPTVPKWFEPFVSNGKFFSPKMDENWELILDEDWNPVFWSTKLEDEPSVTAQLSNAYIDMVNRWVMTAQEAIQRVPALAQNQAFIEWIEAPMEEEKVTKEWSKLNDTTLYNQATWETKDIETWEITSPDASDTQSIISYSTKLRGRTNLQCWELVNDYWTQTTWSRAWMWDTLESKVDALTKVWVSDTPIAWWLFVSNPLWNDVGHTWIVQTINPDGSIEVLEANADGKAEWQIPTTKTYTAEETQNMFFSNAPKAKEEEKKVTDFDQATIPQYTNYLTSWKIGTNKDEMAQMVKQFGSIEEFKRQAEAYNNSPNWPRQRELDKVNKLKTQVEWLLSEENAEALSNSVWTIQTAMSPWTIRDKEAYLANIQNFLDWKTLQNLIDVKAEWATFGALSNEELRMLQNSASALNQLALREDDDDPNRITWFRGSEANFKRKVKETVDEYEKIINKKKKLMWKEQVWETGQTYSVKDLQSKFESWDFSTPTTTFSKEEEDLISEY